MYLEYWGLKEKPFENTSNPKFICLSAQHEEALSRLLYAVKERKAAAMISGIFGCGKTLLAQTLLSQLDRNEYATAFIFNPLLTQAELLTEILYQLGLKEEIALQKALILHRIQEVLTHNCEDGKHTVIIIDEAHLIEDKMIFEELRLLLNFEYKNKFLLTLILIGQPELREKIFNLKQFEQRIPIRYSLSGLKPEEIKTYVQHRLKVAGSEAELFTEESFLALFRSSGGIPRRINQICDFALLLGMGKGVKQITVEVIEEVAADLQLRG